MAEAGYTQKFRFLVKLLICLVVLTLALPIGVSIIIGRIWHIELSDSAFALVLFISGAPPFGSLCIAYTKLKKEIAKCGQCNIPMNYTGEYRERAGYSALPSGSVRSSGSYKYLHECPKCKNTRYINEIWF